MFNDLAFQEDHVTRFGVFQFHSTLNKSNVRTALYCSYELFLLI